MLCVKSQPELDLSELTRYTPNGMGMPPAQGFTHPAVLPPARKSEIFPDALRIPIWEVDLTGCLTSGAHTNSALPNHDPDIRSKVGPAQTACGIQPPHPTPNTSNLRPVPPRGRWFEPDRGPRPNEGYIGLQDHDDKSTAYFKEVAVKPLEKK